MKCNRRLNQIFHKTYLTEQPGGGCNKDKNESVGFKCCKAKVEEYCYNQELPHRVLGYYQDSSGTWAGVVVNHSETILTLIREGHENEIYPRLIVAWKTGDSEEECSHGFSVSNSLDPQKAFCSICKVENLSTKEDDLGILLLGLENLAYCKGCGFLHAVFRGNLSSLLQMAELYKQYGFVIHLVPEQSTGYAGKIIV